MRLGGYQPCVREVALQIGGSAVFEKVVTHCHARTPFALTIKIREHFKGTKMVLVPSGTRGLLRLQDPYGRQIPHYRVLVTKGKTPKTYTYWFQEFRWIPKEV